MIEQFDKYKLIKKIATGGMANIYLAEYTAIKGFKKKLVIKRILPKLASDEKFVSMFIDEAKIAVNLNHRNIVQVFDFGKVEDEYYIAMEFVDGFDLFQIFKYYHFNKEKINESVAIFILMEILKGLSYAHNKTENDVHQLIHRDISLNNIIISKNGDVKILDFGIAKIGDVISGKDLKGKLSYMSPEQLLRRNLDARVDIYAVGILAWRLLTGEKPFELSDYESKEELAKVVIPNLTDVNPNISIELSAIVMKALKKNKDLRYLKTSDFYKALYSYVVDNNKIINHFDFTEYLKININHFKEGDSTDDSTDPQNNRAKTDVSSAHFTTAFNEIHASNEKKSVNLVYFDFKELYKVYEESSLNMMNYLTKNFFHLVSNIAYKYQTSILFLDQHAMAFVVGGIVAKEDDIINSVKFAMEIEETLEAFIQDYNFPLKFSIVIDRGKVIVNKIYKNMKIKLLPIDNLLKRTRRRAEESEPGIFVAHSIKESLFRHFELENIDDNLLKVIKLKKVKSKSSTSKTNLIGRDKELSFLKTKLNETMKEKKSNFIYLIGDAGIGKTRISLEIIDFLKNEYSNNFYFAKGRVLPSDTNTFSIFIDLLRNFINLTTKDKFEYKMNFYLDSLDEHKKREMVSLLGYFLGLNYTNDSYIKELKDNPNFLISLQLTSLKNFFKFLSKKKPIIIFLENIHLSPNLSLDFMNETINQFSEFPIYFLATAREEIFAKRKINHNVYRINVKGLSYENSKNLIINILENELVLSRELSTPPRELLELLYQKSSGNPLFIEEIVKIFKEKNIITIENSEIIFKKDNFNSLDIPFSLEAILQAKFDTLDLEEKKALQRASIFGDKFWLDPLIKILGNSTTQILETLEKKGFLYRRSVGSTMLKVEYIFKHSLLRDIIYDSMIFKIRKEYHLKLADTFKSYNSSKLYRLIAFHYEKAEEYEKTLDFYFLAAERAFEHFATNEAKVIYNKYIELFNISKSKDWNIYFDVKIKLATLHKDLGNYKETEKILKEVKQSIKEFNLDDSIHFKLSIAFSEFYFLEEDYSRALLHINIAKSFYVSQEEYSKILHKEAWVFYKKNQFKKAIFNLKTNIEHIDNCSDVSALYLLYSAVLSESGNYKQGLEYAQKALDYNNERENWKKVLTTLNNIGEIYREHGDLINAKLYYRKALFLSKEKPTTDYIRALLSNNIGALEIANGEYLKAIELLTNSISLLEGINITGFAYETHRLLAQAYLNIGKDEEAYKEVKLAEKLSLAAQNNQNLIMVYLILSDYYQKKESYTEVEYFLLKALSLATSYVDKHTVYKKIIEFYESINSKKINEYRNKLSKLKRNFIQKNR